MTDREAWIKDLSDKVQATRRPAPVRSVLERVSALLHGEPVVFVDNDCEEQDGVSGRLVVFTGRFVAIVDLVGAASMHSMIRPTEEGRVTVQVLPRSRLTALSVERSSDGRLNSDAAWSPQGARDSWPWGGRLSLLYPGVREPVVLPSNADTGFDDLLPSLLEDLAA